MKLLLLLPALVYLGFLALNLQIFQVSSPINFFWLASFNIPVVIFVSIFFILYIVLIWFGFSFSNVFTNMKTKKMEKEIFDLKNKLLSGQGALISEIEARFTKILEAYKADSDKKLELYKKETEKIVTNMHYDMGVLKEKTEKIGKQK